MPLHLMITCMTISVDTRGPGVACRRFAAAIAALLALPVAAASPAGAETVALAPPFQFAEDHGSCWTGGGVARFATTTTDRYVNLGAGCVVEVEATEAGQLRAATKVSTDDLPGGAVEGRAAAKVVGYDVIDDARAVVYTFTYRVSGATARVRQDGIWLSRWWHAGTDLLGHVQLVDSEEGAGFSDELAYASRSDTRAVADGTYSHRVLLRPDGDRLTGLVRIEFLLTSLAAQQNTTHGESATGAKVEVLSVTREVIA